MGDINVSEQTKGVRDNQLSHQFGIFGKVYDRCGHFVDPSSEEHRQQSPQQTLPQTLPAGLLRYERTF